MPKQNIIDSNLPKIHTHNEELESIFTSLWIKSAIGVVDEYTKANKRQASVKILQNIAYLFSYGGMVNHELPFYAIDLSPSGTGKTEVVKKCRQLFLAPVLDLQTKVHQENLRRFQRESQNTTGKKGVNFVSPPMLHKCIHVIDTSPEALFESFEAQKAQMVELGEFGRKLKNPKHQALIDYIIEGYAASELLSPNYKNQRMKETLKIENPQLYFYGDTTLQYLGKSTFFEHINGGLINRCLLIYNSKEPDFDELPKEYKLPKSTITQYNDIAINIISFAKKNKDHSFMLKDTTYRTDCERFLYNKKEALIEVGSNFSNIYTRTLQHFRSLINLFHLIECFDVNEFKEVVTNNSVKQAFEFIEWQMEVYPLLMDELNGVSDEVRLDKKIDKLISYIQTQKLPISFRKLTQAHFGKKAEIQKAIGNQYIFDRTSVIREKYRR